MERMSMAPASEYSLEQVTEAFNRAFTGYFLPMTQTPTSLAEMMRENDVTLRSSLVAQVEGKLAGIGLVAVRGDRGWIAGMGIDPRWRGQGLGRQLLTRLLTSLRDAGVHTALLEALVVNTPAIALYTSAGFHITRELRVYHGPLRFGAEDGVTVERIGPLAPREALRHFTAFHTERPAWQREARTLSRMRRSMEGIGLWAGNTLRAYATYVRQPGGFAVFDAGSCEPAATERRAQIVALLAHLAAGRDDAIARAINVPQDDALGEALDALACPVVARQWEMSRALSEATAPDDGGSRAG